MDGACVTDTGRASRVTSPEVTGAASAIDPTPSLHHLLRAALALERGTATAGAPAGIAVDGTQLRSAVVAHRLVPTLAPWRHQLGLADADVDWLEHAQATHALHALARADAAVAVHRRLHEAGVPAISLKGLALAVRTTGRLDGRVYDDLDVLVHPDDLTRADTVLRAAGLQPAGRRATDAARHVRWTRLVDNQLAYRGDGLPVELHWQLSKFRLLELDFAGLWSERQLVCVGGEALPTLPPVPELLFVATHGANHQFRRLQWLVDVVRLLRTVTDVQWAEVVELGRRHRILRPLAVAATLAGRLEPHGRTVPLGRWDTRMVEWLSDRAWHAAAFPARSEARPWPPPVWNGGQWDEVRAELCMKPDPGYKLRLLASIAVPAAVLEDVRLPTVLAFVRVPLRALVPLRREPPHAESRNGYRPGARPRSSNQRR